MSAQETSLQDTSAQETSDHETSLHETSRHETASQLREALAASSQETSSKTVPPSSSLGSGTRKASSARFGFGGDCTASAPGAYTSPTPAPTVRILRRGRAL